MAPRDTRADLLRALAALAEPPAGRHGELAELLGLPEPDRPDWTETFVVQLVPYGAVYLGAEGMLGGAAANRVAGFWRALRVPPPADADHLSALLGLYASLIDARAAEPPGPRRVLLGHARTALLHEHLLSWLTGYAQAMTDVAPAPYAAWARLLTRTLAAEAGEAGPPADTPAHLRAAPPPAGAGDGLAEVLDSLLVPVRSGVIITHGHLARLARGARLGLRLGDRRRVLRALLEADPPRVSHLLADLADGWAARHLAGVALTGPIGLHWAGRARASAALLRGGPAAPPGPAAAVGEPVRREDGRVAPPAGR